jgi:membrane protein
LFIWLFWCWLILLFGTEIAFAHQNLDYLTRRFQSVAASSEPVDEYLCLAALVSIGARFFKQQPPLSRDELSRILSRGNNLVRRVTQALQDCNLVVQVAASRGASSPQFLPNLPLDRITVREVLDRLRQSRGAALDLALAGEPRLVALLKPLVEAPLPPGWEALSLQKLVEAFAGDGPEDKG